MDISFFESVPFFSLSKTSLQEESLSSEEKSQCLSSMLSLPTPISPFFFDIPPSNNGKDLLVYTRKKNTANDSPLVVSLNPSNLLIPIPLIPPKNVHDESDDDLPIALRKGKRSYTNHLISNFVSY